MFPVHHPSLLHDYRVLAQILAPYLHVLGLEVYSVARHFRTQAAVIRRKIRIRLKEIRFLGRGELFEGRIPFRYVRIVVSLVLF